MKYITSVITICLVLACSVSAEDKYAELKKNMLSEKASIGNVSFLLEQMKYPEAFNRLAQSNFTKNDPFTLLCAFLQYRVIYEYSRVGLNTKIPVIDRPRLAKFIYPSNDSSQKIRKELEKRNLLTPREGWLIMENIRRHTENAGLRMYLTKRR